MYILRKSQKMMSLIRIPQELMRGNGLKGTPKPCYATHGYHLKFPQYSWARPLSVTSV